MKGNLRTALRITRGSLPIIGQAVRQYASEMRYFLRAKGPYLATDVTELESRPILIRKLTHHLERYLWHPKSYPERFAERTAGDLAELLKRGGPEVGGRQAGWARRMLREYAEGESGDTKCPVLIGGVPREKPAVDTEAFLRLARQRRSRRVFQNVPLTTAEKLKVAEATQLAPSSCNRQTIELIFVEDPELKRFVATTIPGGYQFFDTAPCIVVFVSDARDYKYPQDRTAPFIDAAAAVQNVYLLCETMGLGCCWGSYNSFGNIVREDEVRRRLHIPDTHLIVASLAIGRSDQFVCDIPRDPPSRRFGTDCFRNDTA